MSKELEEQLEYELEYALEQCDADLPYIRKALLELAELKEEISDRQETEDSLTQWVADLTKELNELKAKYKNIHIGLDIGEQDHTALVIIKHAKDVTYQYYGRTFQKGSELLIALDDIIENAIKSGFIDIKKLTKEVNSNE